MWKQMDLGLKIVFSALFVGLHLFVGGLVLLVVTCNERIDQTGQMQVPPQGYDRTLEGHRKVQLSYFDDSIEPCISQSDVGIDPCASRRSFGFHGVIHSSSEYPDDPPTLEQVLLNSYGLYSPDDIQEDVLSWSAHLVVRGIFDLNRTRPLRFRFRSGVRVAPAC